MTKQRIKTAGEKVTKAAKHAGKKIGEAAVVVGDLNDDGKSITKMRRSPPRRPRSSHRRRQMGPGP